MKNLLTLSFIAIVLLNFTALAQHKNTDAGQAENFRQLKAKMLSQDENHPSALQKFKSTNDVQEDFGDAPEWNWAKKFAGSGLDIAKASVIDDDGNIYIAGDFSGVMTFAGTTLTSIGIRDVYLAKLDAGGALLWIKHGNCGENASCAAYDIIRSDTHVFVTGYFDGEALSMGGQSVSLSGMSDAFLMKYAFDGQIEMLSNYGNGMLCRGFTLAVDDDQNLYLAGTTDGNTGYYHPSFLAKINPAGNLIWWQEHEIAFSDLAISGDILFVAGSAYQDTWLGNVYLDPNVYADAFVAKGNLDGEFDWAVIGEHQQLPWGDSYLPQISVGSSGDVFMAGYFRTGVEFGGILLSTNSTDSFIVKISPNGEVLWANQTEGAYLPLDGFILLDDEKPCISGGMGISASFDDISIETPDGGEGYYIAIYSNAGVAQSAFVVAHQTYGLTKLPDNMILQSGTTDLDAFISSYDLDGNMDLSLTSAGNSGTSQLTGIEIDEDGVVYSLSNIYGHTDFFGVDINVEKETMILAGHSPNGNVLWTASIEGGISWWYFTETTLKLDEDHERLYLHGIYNDTLKIGNLIFTTPFKGAFTACYSTHGDFIWANNIPYAVDIQSVDSDAAGNVFAIFGFFQTIEIEGQTFTSNSDGDALMLRYDLNGNFTFAKQIKTDVFFYALGIATIPSGGYYLTVEPAGDSVYFNNGNNTMVLTPNDGRCVVAKYDDGGNYLWAKSFGYSPANYGGFYCWPTASVTDDIGNLYLTGTHGDSAMFDNIMLRTPYNRYSPFTAKIDGEGNVLWANSIHIHQWGNNYCEAAIDHEGNFYCMGDLRDTMNIGDWEIIPSGQRSMYLARYNNDGEAAWVKTIDGTSTANHLFGMAVFEPDNLFVGGSFSKNIMVGDEAFYTASESAGFMIHVGDSILYNDIIEGDEDALPVKVFPNPAADFVYLEFISPVTNTEIEITDISGREIQHFVLQGRSQIYTLDFTGLKKGFYLLSVSAEGKTSSRKILIH